MQKHRDLLPRIRPGDFDIFEGYLEKGKQKVIACNALTFGFRAFKNSTIIKRMEELLKCHKTRQLRDVEYVKKNFADVLFDGLIDNIRISVCFENYFKVKLLLNGFVIHTIKKDKNSSLRNSQDQRPISVVDVIQKDSIDKLVGLRDVLNEKTINYSTILNKAAYNRFLTMTPKSLDFLKDINDKRNSLHFYLGEKVMFGDEIFSQYQYLMSVVDGDIAFLQRTILNELDPESRTKLTVDFSGYKL